MGLFLQIRPEKNNTKNCTGSTQEGSTDEDLPGIAVKSGNLPRPFLQSPFCLHHHSSPSAVSHLLPAFINRGFLSTDTIRTSLPSPHAPFNTDAYVAFPTPFHLIVAPPDHEPPGCFEHPTVPLTWLLCCISSRRGIYWTPWWLGTLSGRQLGIYVSPPIVRAIRCSTFVGQPVRQRMVDHDIHQGATHAIPLAHGAVRVNQPWARGRCRRPFHGLYTRRMVYCM